MSQETPGNEIDLIDFNIKSPVLPRATINFESDAETSDNLLDSELPVLEKKLQATGNFASCRFGPRTSVDVEDILITLDDENDCDIAEERKSDRHHHNTLDNNVELLDVLNNLDEVLNACLVESDRILEEKCDSCLKCCVEGDLGTLDSNSDHDNETDNIEDSRDTKEILANEISTDTRTKLRHYEENYCKFLSSGYANRGYINTESTEGIRRPLSACDLHKHAENADHHKHATIGNIEKKRTPLGKNDVGGFDFTYSLRRRPKTTFDSDDDIDWSWLEDVARDINLEKFGTNTSRRNSAEDTPRPPDPQLDNAIIAMRLRDSMRRLDPLLIPHVENSVDDDHNSESTVETTNPVLQLQSVVQERPSIISSVTANLLRSTNSRASRSRSCESHGVERRPRSSSSSTRSRRPRSLSSSLSSASSSAESSPSFNPAATATESIPQASSATSSTRR